VDLIEPERKGRTGVAQATAIGSMDGGGEGPARSFLHEIRAPYKDGQGVVTRRIAYWSGVGLSVWGARDLWVWLQGFGALQRPLLKGHILGLDLGHLPLGGPALSMSVVLATVVGLAALVWVTWFLKRPWLADLLIETESEMKKVSWPARDEATAATRVVSVTVIAFTLVLLVFDVLITEIMKLLTGLPL
jgi:preprotein translocase SecE subunit